MVLKKMKSITKKIVKSLALFVSASLCTSCAYFNGNFHPVKEGNVYRSAQINDGRLEELIQEYEIKTIINLRGESKGKEWYEDEISICKKYNIDHYDVRLSSQSLPKKKAMLELFEIFDNAAYPVLFHCWAGADRAGLVGVLYKLQYEGETLNKALKQLSFFRYGHLNAMSMDNFFKLYKEFGNGRDLRTWVEEDYDETKYENYFRIKIKDCEPEIDGY